MGSFGKKKSKKQSSGTKAESKRASKAKASRKTATKETGKKPPSRPSDAPTRVKPLALGSTPPGEGTRSIAPAPARKTPRKSAAALRRESIATGEILIPGGPQVVEEAQYLFRGCVAAERPSGDAGVSELMTKRGAVPDPASERAEAEKIMLAVRERFETGSIELLLPARPQLARRTFATVIDRARLRRREIGAFLRGLDIGHTESSHLDSHGEDSLETLMKWAARLEKLTEADEPEQADYGQYHRFLDQIENTTEALIVDVEATLRRLRDKPR